MPSSAAIMSRATDLDPRTLSVWLPIQIAWVLYYVGIGRTRSNGCEVFDTENDPVKRGRNNGGHVRYLHPELAQDVCLTSSEGLLESFLTITTPAETDEAHP